MAIPGLPPRRSPRRKRRRTRCLDATPYRAARIRTAWLEVDVGSRRAGLRARWEDQPLAGVRRWRMQAALGVADADGVG
jgi:hypothetical protein